MLLTQPNTHPHVAMHQTHTLPFSGLCPFSGNPQEGSTLVFEYTPQDCSLEVYSLRKYVDSYKGSKGEIRSMEGMVQQTALDCAALLRVRLTVTAHVCLQGVDTMTIVCTCEG